MAKVLLCDDDGELHLRGGFLSGLFTACGHVDTGYRYTEQEGSPTCNSCIDAAKTILESATAKEIKSWRIK